MESLKQKAKFKNILDIEHQRYLTYFNISVISGITSLFGSLLSFITEKINIGTLTLLIFAIAFSSAAAGFIFLNKMNKKLNEIRAL